MNKRKSVKTPEELIESYVKEGIDASIKEHPIKNIQELAETYNNMKKTNNDIELTRMLIFAWSKEKKEERTQKGKYIDIFAKIFIFTVIIIFIIFICIGANWLNYEKDVLEMFLKCVYIEIAAAFIYILKELFKNTSKDLLNFINKFNKK